MARKCKNKGCSKPLNAAAKCTDIIEKKGFCSVECLNRYVKDKRIVADIKKERKKLREAKERLKTKSDYTREAQKWFNKWVRLRDADQPCISCGNTGGHDKGLSGHNYDAGHYRSIGANPELRFEPDNCFKQCVKCNRNLSGNVANMRFGIFKRIGKDRLERVEGNHAAKKYTVDDLKEIKSKYKTLCHEIEKHKNPS